MPAPVLGGGRPSRSTVRTALAGLVTLTTVLGTVVAGAGPAAAAARVVEHDRFSDTLTRVDTTSCGFPIEQTVTADIDDAVFRTDGVLTRVLEMVDHVEITYAAHGTTLTARGTGGIDIRFHADGTVSAATFGIELQLVLPGSGPVFLDAGRGELLFDPHLHVLFEAGPSSYDMGAFCGALS